MYVVTQLLSANGTLYTTSPVSVNELPATDVSTTRVLEYSLSLPVLYSLRGRYNLKLCTNGAKFSPRANQLYLRNHDRRAGTRKVTGFPFAREGRLIKDVSNLFSGRVGMYTNLSSS